MCDTQAIRMQINLAYLSDLLLHFFQILSEAFAKSIRQHYHILLCSLNRLDELSAWMFQTGCLTRTNLDFIKSFSTAYSQTEELLKIVMMRDESAYNMFLIGLLHTNQDDLHKLLTVQGLLYLRLVFMHAL